MLKRTPFVTPSVKCPAWATLLLTTLICFPASKVAVADVTDPTSTTDIARIRLYNPTQSAAAVPVEVPLGRIAAPGLVDWRSVRLIRNGESIPFTIREGTAHWKAKLVSPVTEPRAEDILVFSCAVEPDTWVEIGITSDTPDDTAALRIDGGRIQVTYPDLQVVIDEGTGKLLAYEYTGRQVLEGPMAYAFRNRGESSAAVEPHSVDLVTSSSTPAMTELHFVITVDSTLQMALTYRIHSCGAIEILADERPWDVSPWDRMEASWSLPLVGEVQNLESLVNRAPFYHFKDFLRAVRQPAAVWRTPNGTVLEVGEEFVNGRRWLRRLYPLCADHAQAGESLAELVDEGFVVETEPVTAALRAETVVVLRPDSEAAPAGILVDGLGEAGFSAQALTVPGSDDSAAVIELKLLDTPAAAGIEGDGFAVRRSGDRFVIEAGTRFGLTQAALRIGDFLTMHPQMKVLPLVASNPVVQHRAAGFGGGGFEVDFAQGTQEEWLHVLEALVHSGMNVMSDMSMWSSWKMPVSYQYMPELRSEDGNDFDPLTGVAFRHMEQYREQCRPLHDYLRALGVKVWQELPLGCVPTTYATVYPEAMGHGAQTAAGDTPIPCPTHPQYAKFLEAFLRELVETYPIDGLWLARDDNGGICNCERCKLHLKESRTHDQTWEQYLIVYDILRRIGFQGDVAIYPYNDPYKPQFDALVPNDLLMVGHGAGDALPFRQLDHVWLFPDTWIDNVYAGFRPAASPRVRRVQGDRPAFWVGGAYWGSELAWEAIGYFGWEPTATVNTFRFERGARLFGPQHAVDYLQTADVYEELWELYTLPMFPHDWVRSDSPRRAEVSGRARRTFELFRTRLSDLRAQVSNPAEERSLQHMALFGTYFEYLLVRLDALSEMTALAAANREALERDHDMHGEVRQQLVATYKRVLEMSERLDAEAANLPGHMLADTRKWGLFRPNNDWWISGWHQSMDQYLPIPQLAGQMKVTVGEVAADSDFVIQVEVRNMGVIPWAPGWGHRLEVTGDAEKVGLPSVTAWDSQWLALGETAVIELHGHAPAEPGVASVKIEFLSPSRKEWPQFNRYVLAAQELKLEWSPRK